MAKAATRWLDSIRADRRIWLTFCGYAGTGKTHLARYLLRASRAYMPDEAQPMGTYQPKGKWHTLLNPCIFVDWRKACDDFRAGEWWIIDDMVDAWCVVIDDMGAEYDPNGMITSKLDRVLNSRLRLPTIITTNLSLSGIAETLGPRIASRIIRDGSIVCETSAQDFATRERRSQ